MNPATSAQPFIDDLGESAVEAMGQAVKEGFGRMVSDLGLDITDPTSGAAAAGETVDGQVTRSNSSGNVAGGGGVGGSSLPSRGITPSSSTGGAGAAAGVNGLRVPAQHAGTRGKRIPMPAGFPYSNPTSSDVTPMATPGLGLGLGNGNGNDPSYAGASGASTAPGLTSRSSFRPALSTAPSGLSVSASGVSGVSGGSGVSGRIGDGQSQFRFRGQFAGTDGQGSSLDETRRMVDVRGQEGRRVGVLNSRA